MSALFLVGRTWCHCAIAVGLVGIIRRASFLLKARSPWICWVRVRVSIVLMRRATIARIDGGNALSISLILVPLGYGALGTVEPPR